MPPIRLLIFSAIALGTVGCAQQSPPPMTAASPSPVASSPATVTTGQEVSAGLRNHIQVEFASGSDHLMPGADEQLDIAARLFRDVRPVSMFSTGYSDAKGDEFTNLILAARRARTVKMALIARGIPANQILLRSFGESAPIDRSQPDAPANRRVLVTWEIL